MLTNTIIYNIYEIGLLIMKGYEYYMESSLRTIASKEFKYESEVYKIVDFINKNISRTNLVLGLTKKDSKSIITIYEEE